uniref:Ig-like domain-containing protein n=1 Tax=Echeneis naucrates TaxID=173247 RepID=A0A665SZB3_ECHNA
IVKHFRVAFTASFPSRLPDYTCTDRPVFNPSNLVVKYQDPTSVTCTVCPTCQSLFNLERALGHHTRNGSTLKWTVKNMTEWDPKTTCFLCLSACLFDLVSTGPPDSVSISFVDHSGPMSEGRPYTLQCKVQNVAPVKNLTVTFYKGQTALGQQQSNNTNKKPVSETFTLVIRPSKEDSRVKFWCEAKLELGPEGPKPPPVVESQRVSATVHKTTTSFKTAQLFYHKHNSKSMINLMCTSCVDGLLCANTTSPAAQ